MKNLQTEVLELEFHEFSKGHAKVNKSKNQRKQKFSYLFLDFRGRLRQDSAQIYLS